MTEKNSEQHSQKSPTSFWFALFNSTLKGALSGGAEVAIDHPFFSLKMLFQAPKTTNTSKEHPLLSFKKSLSAGDKKVARALLFPAVKSLYWGIKPNMASMIPITAMQVTVGNIAIKNFSQHTSLNLERQKILAGGLGGIAAAVIAGPTEFLLGQQQIYNVKHSNEPQTFLQTTQRILKTHGINTFKTGMSGTAARDSIFASGFFGLLPMAQTKAEAKIKNRWLSLLVANTSTGIVVAALSQGADTVKSRQQLCFPDHQSFFATAKTIYKEEGFKGFYHGGFWRALRVTFALPIISGVQNQYDQIMPKFSR